MHFWEDRRTIDAMETIARTPYPTDVADDEWAFLAPYLILMREDAPQRHHSSRELFNGLRFVARTGLQWRSMPHDLPPWSAVYQQTRRWMEADVFGTIIADLRELIRIGTGRAAQPTAVILDSRTLQSTPESGARANWDGAKRRTGSKVHLAIDTMGQLLALCHARQGTGPRPGCRTGERGAGGDGGNGDAGLRRSSLHRRHAEAGGG